MKLADLDRETRAVIFVAHIVAIRPTIENLLRLEQKLKAFDEKHKEEREQNLLRALSEEAFREPGTKRS
jgi:hypothetical protein